MKRNEKKKMMGGRRGIYYLKKKYALIENSVCRSSICIDVFLREPNPKKLTCFLFGAGFWLNRAAFFSSIFCFTISLFRPSCTTWDV